jgi:FtsH-binding integral membrane protein
MARNFHDEYFKTTQITRPIQNHLQRVYSLLTATAGSAALGSYLDLFYYDLSFGGLISLLGLGCFFLIHILDRQNNDLLRHFLLLAFGFCQGVGINPLIANVMIIDPTILFQAMVTATLVFASFSATALVSERRSLLYMGSFLLSGLMLMAWTSLANIFFLGSPALFNIQLYLGLALFAGFVMFDTQIIVERAAAGDYDVVRHSADLFTDLFSLFQRILVIMANNSSEKRRENKRK